MCGRPRTSRTSTTPRALAARDFYDELKTAVMKNAGLPDRQASDLLAYPIIGTFQPTFLSARLVERALSLRNTVDGVDDSGDGTVPAGSAVPHDLDDTAVGMRVAQVHGSLQNDDAVLNHVIGSIMGQRRKKPYYLGGLALPGLDFDDVYVAGRTQQLKVSVAQAEPEGLVADIVDARTSANANSPRRVAQCPFKKAAGGDWRADFNLPKGVYRVTVRGSNVQPATDCIVVAEA